MSRVWVMVKEECEKCFLRETIERVRCLFCHGRGVIQKCISLDELHNLLMGNKNE